MHPPVNWNNTLAAIWRPAKQYLRPVRRLDPITLDTLLGVDTQKEKLLRNTQRFLDKLPANNVLLWGARGTGKSSLIKALLNRYAEHGLRIVEVDRDDLGDMQEIVDQLQDQPFRFVVFCDDLSFESGERGYRALKSVLEGSMELPPDNVLLYATSNRRHLMPESMQDNLDSGVVGGELHYADAVEEKISLSDRFGLWLSFYPVTMDQYLEMVDGYFPGYSGDRAALHEAARLFARTRGARSGRTAKQFHNWYADSVPS